MHYGRLKKDEHTAIQYWIQIRGKEKEKKEKFCNGVPLY